MATLVPIILAGGIGKRLWPLSVQSYPKQFHCLFNQQSLFQTTVTRLNAFADACDPLIITHRDYRFIVAEQLLAFNPSARILLEQQHHNTAVAITLAVLYAISEQSDPMILVCPSDQYIGDASQFTALVNAAIPVAAKGKLVTFGVVPTEPATGYGYIQKGHAVADTIAFDVQKFVEKPSKKLAENYLESGQYLWNSGIFLFQASFFLEELQLHAPNILQGCNQAMSQIVSERDYIHFDSIPDTCPNLPIDIALFEKTQHAVVIPFPGEWHDLGTWHALYELSAKDTHGNVKHGHIISQDTQNSYVYSTQPLLVATCGIQDCCIVVTKDTLLIADLTTVDLEKKLEKIAEESGAFDLPPEDLATMALHNLVDTPTLRSKQRGSKDS